MNNSLALFVLAFVPAAMLALGFKTGAMPTYLTGSVRRSEDPIGLWFSGSALAVVLLGCLYVAIAML